MAKSHILLIREDSRLGCVLSSLDLVTMNEGKFPEPVESSLRHHLPLLPELQQGSHIYDAFKGRNGIHEVIGPLLMIAHDVGERLGLVGLQWGNEEVSQLRCIRQQSEALHRSRLSMIMVGDAGHIEDVSPEDDVVWVELLDEGEGSLQGLQIVERDLVPSLPLESIV